MLTSNSCALNEISNHDNGNPSSKPWGHKSMYCVNLPLMVEL